MHLSTLTVSNYLIIIFFFHQEQYYSHNICMSMKIIYDHSESKETCAEKIWRWQFLTFAENVSSLVVINIQWNLYFLSHCPETSMHIGISDLGLSFLVCMVVLGQWLKCTEYGDNKTTAPSEAGQQCQPTYFSHYSFSLKPNSRLFSISPPEKKRSLLQYLPSLWIVPCNTFSSTHDALSLFGWMMSRSPQPGRLKKDWVHGIVAPPPTHGALHSQCIDAEKSSH